MWAFLPYFDAIFGIFLKFPVPEWPTLQAIADMWCALGGLNQGISGIRPYAKGSAGVSTFVEHTILLPDFLREVILDKTLADEVIALCIRKNFVRGLDALRQFLTQFHTGLICYLQVLEAFAHGPQIGLFHSPFTQVFDMLAESFNQQFSASVHTADK